MLCRSLNTLPVLVGLWLNNKLHCYCNVIYYLPRGVLVLLKCWQFSSELPKNLEFSTECGVWTGNCNVKVCKSTEHKLHKIWRSLKCCTNWGKQAHPENHRFLSSNFKLQFLWCLNSQFLWVHMKNVQISGKRAHPR